MKRQTPKQRTEEEHERRVSAIVDHEATFPKRASARTFPRRRLRQITFTGTRLIERLEELLRDAGFVVRWGSRSYDLWTDASAAEVDALLMSVETMYGLGKSKRRRT